MVDIKKLALLARIKLEEGDEEKFQKDFEAILGYVKMLKDVQTEGEVSENDSSELVEIGLGPKNVMRKDDDTNEPGAYSEDLLKTAPATEKGYVKVKHVFG